MPIAIFPYEIMSSILQVSNLRLGDFSVSLIPQGLLPSTLNLTSVSLADGLTIIVFVLLSSADSIKGRVFSPLKRPYSSRRLG